MFEDEKKSEEEKGSETEQVTLNKNVSETGEVMKIEEKPSEERVTEIENNLETETELETQPETSLETKCKKCGSRVEEGVEFCSNCSKKRSNIFKNKKFLIFVVVIIITISIVLIIMHNKAVEEERYNNLPIKVDISMTSYYGTIEYILYELDLDFDLVTMGANCLTGVQRNEFKTEKYGVLHTEFRYCQMNRTTVFRVYNDEKDQELRDPKSGELPQFDTYGKKLTTSSSIS